MVADWIEVPEDKPSERRDHSHSPQQEAADHQ